MATYQEKELPEWPDADQDIPKYQSKSGYLSLVTNLSVLGMLDSIRERSSTFFKVESLIKNKLISQQQFINQRQTGNSRIFFEFSASQFEKGDVEGALKTLTSIVELDLDNPQLYR